MAHVVKVSLPGGGELHMTADKFTWQAHGHVNPHLLKAAQRIADDYSWTPDHGYPGHKLADMVARELGGRAVLPDIPPLPEGAVS